MFMCFFGLVLATCDPSIEVISLMKALHVLNLHWTTLYEVSVTNCELSYIQAMLHQIGAYPGFFGAK